MNLYIIVAIIGWAIWSFGAKVSATQIHPMWLQIVNYGLGFLFIPIFYSFIKHSSTNNISFHNCWWAIISSIFGLIAYASYTMALQKGDGGTTTVLCSTYPAITFILSAIFLGEAITLVRMIGIETILFGCFLLCR